MYSRNARIGIKSTEVVIINYIVLIKLILVTLPLTTYLLKPTVINFSLHLKFQKMY